MNKSNLRLRSNIHFRTPDLPVYKDQQFLPRIRGYEGVRSLLRSLGLQPDQIRYDDAQVLAQVQVGRLTPAQRESLKWGIPCARCNMIPCGINFQGDYEFRCDISECGGHKQSTSAHTKIKHRFLVPSSVLRNFRGNLSDVLHQAIELCNQQPPNISLPSLDAPIILEINQPVTQQYTNEQLATFLVYGIQQSQMG